MIIGIDSNIRNVLWYVLYCIIVWHVCKKKTLRVGLLIHVDKLYSFSTSTFKAKENSCYSCIVLSRFLLQNVNGIEKDVFPYFVTISVQKNKNQKPKTRSNMKMNCEKLNLIPTCTTKLSLSRHHEIFPSIRPSFFAPKCFHIMNIQVVEFDCYLHKRTVTILPSSILNKKNRISVRLYSRILSRFLHRTIKNLKRYRIWK